MGHRPPTSPVLAAQPACGAVEVRRTAQGFVLEAAGEIDASLAEPVQSAMSVIQAGSGSVEVDFSAATFCGAEGVHMLHRLRATHRLDDQSTTLSDAAALTMTICDLPPAPPDATLAPDASEGRRVTSQSGSDPAQELRLSLRRQTVEDQAVGVLMQRRACSATTAESLLANAAAEIAVPVHLLASAVISSTTV